MSANKDKDQKFRFVYSNLYQILNKKDSDSGSSNENSVAIPSSPVSTSKSSLSSSRVIKAEDINSGPSSYVTVNPYIPTEMMGKRVQRPSVIPAQKVQADALEGLKGNLKTLEDLQARLRFVLKELEELIEE